MSASPARLHTRLYPLFVALAFGATALTFSREQLERSSGVWSAPLDDAFIHAAFARSAALGRPLHWIATDGVSSGGTSVLWPLLLAGPWALGARGVLLVPVARALAVLLFASGFALLEKPLRRVHASAPWVAAALVAADGPTLWHAYSGMELALVFAALAALLRAAIAYAESPSHRTRHMLGVAGVVAVLARPECAIVVGALASLAAAAPEQALDGGQRRRVPVFLAAAGPAAATLAALACVYGATTGSFGASGIAAKLLPTHPMLTGAEVFERFASNIVFAFRRVTSRDLTVDPLTKLLDPHLSLGAIAFALALAPAAHRFASAALAFGLFLLAWGPARLFDRDATQAIVGVAFLVPLVAFLRPRPFAPERLPALLVLVASVWGIVAATNGQVVYHLDRYLMPGRALWLVAAAAGCAALLDRSSPRHVPALPASVALALAAWTLASNAGAHRRWREHFGRACENVHEQHMEVARALREIGQPVSRVLVNDAGVIPYLSERPALDFVGLGGFGKLPWARANRMGVGASLELLERVPKQDWPSHMAIYPGWFPGLGENFGRELQRFPVHENVICGGLEHVLYEARWETLRRGDVPADPREARALVADIDLGDLVSEGEHGVRTSRPASRDFRVMTSSASESVFDGGVRLGSGELVSFDLDVPAATHVALRIAALEHAVLRLAFDEQESELRTIEANSFWNEFSVRRPPGAKRMTLAVASGRVIAAHAWLVAH